MPSSTPDISVDRACERAARSRREDAICPTDAKRVENDTKPSGPTKNTKSNEPSKVANTNAMADGRGCLIFQLPKASFRLSDLQRSEAMVPVMTSCTTPASHDLFKDALKADAKSVTSCFGLIGVEP